MQVQVDELRPFLESFDLTGLMVEGLGRNHHQGPEISAIAGNESYELRPVAEKAGFAVYCCSPAPDGGIPPQSLRRQIENQVSQASFEHLIIFLDAAESRQVWQWVKRESGKPPALRELRYEKGQTGTALLQRLRGLEFTLEEEGNLGITDVIPRLRQALDVERVTKRFYEQFRKELADFQKFITGITAQGDRDWYASLMLNRLMFVYFIQKQNFLDGDEHYLRHRLERIQEKDGPDQFQRFYRKFLLRLFHEGLGQPESDRSPELTALLGKVPYLNGGIFDRHALERDNPEINIPDAAFEQIFRYFDQYQWHLDDRPTGNDNEINPDVLGYIFEKYVNQKQMGAYYTKEDITGYIARNTVIPRLLEMAQAECPVAFTSGGGVWRLLQDDPDNYIYPSVDHGVAWDYYPESIARLEQPLTLPDNIAAGLEDTTKRDEWNRAAPEDYALPTETWRELIARRQRYTEVRDKLADGEVQSVNDLITLNLDSERFARDVIVNSEGPELVRALWNALTRISVLDPACGSGAFLFAALNILEPLYSATLQAMRGFLADLETSQRPRPPQALRDFREILDAAGQHRNERYYILKSIIVNNLYGVDIMEEAVEICRLRLFLKLAAQLENYNQIEPLPDIDFNIQPGNTLVGFTSLNAVRSAMEMDLKGQRRMMSADDEDALRSIENKAASIARQYQQFQYVQTEYGMGYAELADSKQNLQSRLNELRSELDALLAREYGVDADKSAPFRKWQASYQPFHWFVEFHAIMHSGGFDVVVGNPPYVEYSKVKDDYTIKGYETESSGNLYAFMMERSGHLLNGRGHYGMIVPSGVLGLSETRSLRGVLFDRFANAFCSTFSIRPSKLFDGVDQRLCIFLADCSNPINGIKTTQYHHWNSEERSFLFHLLCYAESSEHSRLHRIPQIGSPVASRILAAIEQMADSTTNSYYALKRSGTLLHYHRSPRYWIRAMDFEQYFQSATRSRSVHHFRDLHFDNTKAANAVGAVLNSSIFFFWFITLGNGRNITGEDVGEFPVGTLPEQRDFSGLFDRLMEDYKRHSVFRRRSDAEFQEFHPSKSKSIIDEIDRVLAEHYGFTEEELDFIINYDIKYRMGREG